MGTAEQMNMILVRSNRFHLDRKPSRNFCRRFLDNRGRLLIQLRLAVFHLKHDMIVYLPRTARRLANFVFPLIRHAPKGIREADPRSMLPGSNRPQGFPRSLFLEHRKKEKSAVKRDDLSERGAAHLWRSGLISQPAPATMSELG